MGLNNLKPNLLMSVMKFTIEIDLESTLENTQSDYANLPLPELESLVKESLTESLNTVVNDYGCGIRLKDEQGKEIYL